MVKDKVVEDKKCSRIIILLQLETELCCDYFVLCYDSNTFLNYKNLYIVSIYNSIH